MKKMWMIGLTMALLLIVSACSSNENLGFSFDPDGENVVTLALSEDDYDTEITYEADGDIIKKQTTRSEASYDQYGVQSKASAEVAFNEIVEQYQSIDGIDFDIEFFDEKVEQSLTIDFENIDADDLKEVPGVNIDGNLKKGVSLKATVEVLQEQGYQIVD
ncbi:MAG TPA: DUF1307 domain-containing protein [Pseudogracilibacillus sp.]|nr:DUF1307 domain-containing protein [Pseudogracilibacillus sp.]